MVWNIVSLFLTFLTMVIFARHVLHMLQAMDALKLQDTAQGELNIAVDSCLKFNQLVYTYSQDIKTFIEHTRHEYLKAAFKFFIANRENGNAATRIAELTFSIYSLRQKNNFENMRNAEKEIRALGWLVSLLTFSLVAGGVIPFSARAVVVAVAVVIFGYGVFFSTVFVEPLKNQQQDNAEQLKQLRDMVELTLASCEAGHPPEQLKESLRSLTLEPKSRKLAVA